MRVHHHGLAILFESLPVMRAPLRLHPHSVEVAPAAPVCWRGCSAHTSSSNASANTVHWPLGQVFPTSNRPPLRGEVAPAMESFFAGLIDRVACHPRREESG